MASITRASSVTLFLSFNLLFFAIVSGTTDCLSCRYPPSNGSGGNRGSSGNGGGSGSGGGSGNGSGSSSGGGSGNGGGSGSGGGSGNGSCSGRGGGSGNGGGGSGNGGGNGNGGGSGNGGGNGNGGGSGNGGGNGNGGSSGNGQGRCPRDALKLGVCANLLNLVNVVVGSPPTLPCCTLIQGLADLEVALCLCTAIRANILGINLNVPVALSLILNNCGRNNTGFTC